MKECGVPPVDFMSSPLPQDPLGVASRADEARFLYVHAPFCVRRCFYCDFAVTVDRGGDPDGWIGALEAELRAHCRKGRGGLAPHLDTLYVGGGTPSLLGPGAMQGLKSLLGDERIPADQTEWTAECNPESLTHELAVAWRAAGVNRLSIGVQSFDETVLRWMGRMHGREGAIDAISNARSGGIHNLSLDLIFGLPEELHRSWGR